jgi:hypothetical protein
MSSIVQHDPAQLLPQLSSFASSFPPRSPFPFQHFLPLASIDLILQIASFPFRTTSFEPAFRAGD